MRPRIWNCLWRAVITGLALCIANFAMDILMDRMGVSGSKTILNDLAIGTLGAVGVFFYLSASYAKHDFETARARINMIGELNRRIRDAIGLFATSAISEDPSVRLRGIDEATARIDDILFDFLSEQDGNKSPRSKWPDMGGKPKSPNPRAVS